MIPRKTGQFSAMIASVVLTFWEYPEKNTLGIMMPKENEDYKNRVIAALEAKGVGVVCETIYDDGKSRGHQIFNEPTTPKFSGYKFTLS